MRLVIHSFAIIMLVFTTTGNVAAANINDTLRNFLLGSEQAPSTGESRFSIDTGSQECINCHNGISAVHITVRAAGSALQTAGWQTTNHPIGMTYRDAAYDSPYTYKAEETLDRAIRLVDGKVGCVSCHQLKPDDSVVTDQLLSQATPQCSATNQLTVGVKKSDLCMACHNL